MTRTEVLSAALARRLIASQGRALRVKHQLSVPEVAGALGVSPVVVTSWESGRAQPRRANALAYAELLMELDALDEDAGDAS